MRLAVEDDGGGFDPQGVDRENHFGLQLMKERVELAGGLIHLQTAFGEGTGIIIRLPAETSSTAS
jgi:signal transduction histidine kinase